MEDLTDRQKEYLLTAMRHQSTFCEYFDREAVQNLLQWETHETSDTITALTHLNLIDGNRIATQLLEFAKAGDREGFRIFAGSKEHQSHILRTKLLPAVQVLSLTQRGRELARHLAGEKRKARKGRWLSSAKYAWGLLVSLAIPISVAFLNNKINAQKSTSPASTIPTPTPQAVPAVSPSTQP